MKHEPALMTRALDLHNSVIRKARWTNFGYTIAQEGDSYSLVFYEAMDAVSFCLQVSYCCEFSLIFSTRAWLLESGSWKQTGCATDTTASRGISSESLHCHH